MATYNAIDIARWFIARNEVEKSRGADPMTLLKLLKLLYYAEGCSLASENGSLFNEKIVAWEHGPVVEEVYHAYNNPYSLPFGSDEDIASVERINTNETDRDILEQVFDIFGQYSAWGLRNMTHDESPWKEATGNGKYLKHEINRNTMKEYFKENYLE